MSEYTELAKKCGAHPESREYLNKLEAALSAANAAIAMKDEALKNLHEFVIAELSQQYVRVLQYEDTAAWKLTREALSTTPESIAAWKESHLGNPYAYAGEFDVNDIRDMRTVVYRELSGFKTETKQPDVIYPLYRGEKL